MIAEATSELMPHFKDLHYESYLAAKFNGRDGTK
jgi:hypothetical protein